MFWSTTSTGDGGSPRGRTTCRRGRYRRRRPGWSGTPGTSQSGADCRRTQQGDGGSTTVSHRRRDVHPHIHTRTGTLTRAPPAYQQRAHAYHPTSEHRPPRATQPSPDQSRQKGHSMRADGIWAAQVRVRRSAGRPEKVLCGGGGGAPRPRVSGGAPTAAPHASQSQPLLLREIVRRGPPPQVIRGLGTTTNSRGLASGRSRLRLRRRRRRSRLGPLARPAPRPSQGNHLFVAMK